MGLTLRKILEDELDDLWREAIRKRDNYTCQMCGRKNTQLHAHHIRGRVKIVRWLTKNGVLLCGLPCHKNIHENPREFDSWLKEWLGVDTYYLLDLLKNKVYKPTLEDLEEIKEKLVLGTVRHAKLGSEENLQLRRQRRNL